VSQQERRIEDLEQHGHDATLARALLETFLSTQAQFVRIAINPLENWMFRELEVARRPTPGFLLMKDYQAKSKTTTRRG
jgi:hypothetical protein